MEDKLYVNFRKATLVVDNISFKEGKVYPASTIESPSHEIYVRLNNYLKAIEVLRRISVESLSAVDCEKLALVTLKELGE